MDKFLFTDGTNGVREAQSQQELEILIESAEQPDKIRIWLFSSNEWITYTAFRKQIPAIRKEKTVALVDKTTIAKKNSTVWVKKILYIAGAAAGVFLVFNFTKIKWEKAEPVNISAVRPDNVPVMDMDSLIWEIEDSRGQTIDRNTKNNLRLRNTWPDKIELKLHSEREKSNTASRFFNVDISIDNSTGFNLDNAVVKISVWKNSKLSGIDTLRFNNIRYDKLLTRQLDNTYRGDSISVSFESIKAKAFNFCYSVATKNNSGNYNDRWFCRD
jgi:hypothetical protein